ncbi:hypothetical protein MJ547_04615, partial [Burkholderia gladioli]
MSKSLIAAALAAASLFTATATAAHASWFGLARDPSPEPSTPVSLASEYVPYTSASTFLGKAHYTNPVAYEPSASLIGLRLGESLASQAAACAKNVLPTHVCTTSDTLSKGVVVAGLPDLMRADLAFGRAIVGTDASGRINAVVLPMKYRDVLAVQSLKGFLYRFGAPSSINDHEAVWDLPDGSHAKLVYDSISDVKRDNTELADVPTTSVLYAAVYAKDAGPTLPALLKEGLPVIETNAKIEAARN